MELAIKIHMLLYIKYITKKDLLYSTWNYVQCLVKTCNVKESKKECIYTHTYMYIYIERDPSQFVVYLKQTYHCKSILFQLKILRENSI